MYLKIIFFSCIVFANSYPLEKHPLLSYYQNEEPFRSLSDDVTPLHYTLKIDTDLQRFTYKGTVEIRVFVNKATDKIELFSDGLTIEKFKLTQQTKEIEGMEIQWITHGIIAFKSVALTEKTEYLISIDFSGTLNDNMIGFYRSSYEVNGIKKWLAVTQFQPNYARKAFPCFDEPRFRTTFTISLARNGNQVTTSNTPSRVTIDNRSTGGKIWEEYQTTQPMPTYLVAFMVSEFSKTSSAENEKVNALARENAIQYTNYAVTQGRRLLTSLESWTGVTYKLQKLDIVAVPDFSMGGMENWGMTTFRERFVILNEASASAQHKRIVTEMICHEFSHQWFGNSITPTKWDYLWLNEGFATYLEYFITASLETNWNMEELFITEVVIPALWIEPTRQRAMTTAITLPSQLDNMFDIISYEKAGAVLKMLEHIMSLDSFKKAIQTYLIEGQNKNGGKAEPQVFWDALENQVKQDSIKLPTATTITQIMQSWTENPGYPLITVTKDSNTKKVKLTQTTYKSKRAPSSPSDQKWIVPITCTTKSAPVLTDTKPYLWSTGTTEVELPKDVEKDEWVICNPQYSGYYRVNYDDGSWKLIIDHLNADIESIPPVTKAKLIDDSHALALDGYLSHDIPMKIASAMRKDSNVVSWLSLISYMDAGYAKYADTSYESDLKVFIRDIIYNKIRDQLGFNVKETDTLLTKIGRTRIYSMLCRLDLAPCFEGAKTEYDKNSKDISQVHPDLKPIVYCGILRNGIDSKKIGDELWSAYEKTDIAYDKNVILTAFGCARSETVLLNVLAKLSDGIRKQDRRYLINAITYSSTSVNAALKFLRRKILSSANNLDDDSSSIINSILSSVEPRLQTKTHIELLEKIETDLKEITQNDESFTKHLTAIQEASKVAKQQIEKREEEAYELAKAMANAAGTTPPKPLKPSSEEASASVNLIPSCLLVVFANFIFYLSF